MVFTTNKSTALVLLILNLLLYFVMTAIAAWAINQSIDYSHETASHLKPPVRLFPMYFPMGSMSTGFFVVFSLIAGVVGMITSAKACIHNTTHETDSDMYAAAGSSLVALSLTLLSLGLACKETHLGKTDSNLRILKVMTILVSVTQLLYTGAIHDELQRIPVRHNLQGGRV